MTNAPAGDRVADAAPSNWVDRYAPAAWRPYLRLARIDRPIGTWLLLWPCLWASALAAAAAGDAFPPPGHLVLFVIGAIVMRGAGCAYNDIVDRDFDAQVARTALRPIPSGAVSVRAACAFLVALSLTGLIVLLQFNHFTIGLGIASLAIVAAYPFMKRITYWPQAWLGITFNWGALMGWSAATGGLATPALFLYAAGFFWTLGYDTIYAHQDKEDDALIGVKSTALKFGRQTKPWLFSFYGLALLCFAAAGATAGVHPVFHLGLIAAGAHLAWQAATVRVDNPDSCLTRFRSNRDFGLILFVTILASGLLS
ncbi:MAG: 4-hydroxybenzoate octaprenyltransferase [Pseudomonadota bacterium]